MAIILGILCGTMSIMNAQAIGSSRSSCLRFELRDGKTYSGEDAWRFIPG